VTSSPAGLNFHSNREPAGLLDDQVALKSVLENWGGLTAARSRRERALFQIEQLHRFEERSNGTLIIVKVFFFFFVLFFVLLCFQTRADLENVLRLHAGGQAVVGGLLGIEGLHALDSDLSFVERFYTAGVRMAAVCNSSLICPNVF
jgi:membrane dipeptidase